MSNQTNTDFNAAITRLEESLERARDLPNWAVTMIVIIALLCAIILMHVMALMAAGPCLYAAWARKRRAEHNQLLTDEIIDPDGSTELAPAEAANTEESMTRA